MKKEQFREIPNYGYEVSNFGNVRKVGSTTILRGYPNRNGYHQVMLYNEDGYKLHYTHRLVALAFLPPPLEDNMQVGHLDGNKENNNADNLYYHFASAWKNKQHGIKFQRCSSKKEKYDYVIKQMTRTGFTVALFSDFNYLALLGYKQKYIEQASRGTYYKDTYKGYKWQIIKTLKNNKQHDK